MNKRAWLGNYQANTATPAARTALARITKTLEDAIYTGEWISAPAYSLVSERDITGYLAELTNKFNVTYFAVSNDHTGVPQDVFHKSMDFYSVNDLLAWYAGDCEEPAY